MIMRLFPALALLLLLGACDADDKKQDAPAPESRGAVLAHRLLIADTHIDVPYRVEASGEDVTVATKAGDFDLPRARAGGLDVAFMSIYTPAEYEFEEPGKARAHAERMIALVEDIAARAPQAFMIPHSTRDVLSARDRGLIALPLGMENGAPIAGDLAALDHFHEKGIRYITLAHSRSNHIADSSYDEARPNGGLSPFGKEVVRRMNELGIMVDVSHISDEAFADVLEISEAPPIASHSSARHFTPGFERNMSDEMIEDLGGRGGVVMINFGSAFLTAEANAWSKARSEAWKSWLAESGEADTPENEKAFETRYRAEHPYPYATIENVLDHIDHVVALAGIEAVGIGSDFDGVGDSLPVGLKDVSAYPALIDGLIARGYSDIDIEKIMGGNLMRVWRQVESVAARLGG
ncbi:MAG: dipeptidase [Rhodothalassiaceae bacterium]